MIPIDKVKKIIEKHISLEQELSTGKVDPKFLPKKSKEYAELKDIVPYAKEYIEFEKNKKDLNNIIEDKKNDKEMITLAEKELKDAEDKKEKNETKLKIFLLPKDKDDEKNIKSLYKWHLFMTIPSIRQRELVTTSAIGVSVMFRTRRQQPTCSTTSAPPAP